MTEKSEEQSMQTISLQLPDNLRINPQEIKEALSAVMYYNGTLSMKEACGIIGATRRDFEELILPKFNLSILGGTQEDIDIETEGL